MWFKHRAWIPVAWGLAAVNAAAVWFAAEPAEPWHATIHAALAVGFTLGAERLRTRRQLAAQDERVEAVLDENEQLHETLADMEARLLELGEHLDSAERLLARQRDPER